MPLKKENCKRILVISLSNVGDVFLTIPVIRLVQKAFPTSTISVLVGEKAKDVFTGERALEEIIPYNKNISLWDKAKFIQKLRQKKFDLVVDLRHSLFPFFIGAPYHTPLFYQIPKDLHRMDQHLWKLGTLGIPIGEWREQSLWGDPESEARVEKRLGEIGIREKDPFVVFSPGSKTWIKQWKASSYAELSDRLYQDKKIPTVFVGEAMNLPLLEKIVSEMQSPYHSWVGKTSLSELVALIRRATLLVTNDSAALHIGSLLNVSTVALFGPTDPKKYGPRSDRHRLVRKELFCSPCEKAQCPYHHECMEQLSTEEVYRACCELLPR